MVHLSLRRVIIGLFVWLVVAGCTKETIVITGNNPPDSNFVPSIKIENYVNRVFIDLLGREPLNAEMDIEVARLKDAQLSDSARLDLILRLQYDTSFVEGDGSYLQAYGQHLYNLAKVRCLEGVGDNTIQYEFLEQEMDTAQMLLLQAVLDARTDFTEERIHIGELFARMIHNAVYDEINMNTTNFVEAAFDNLLWRQPTNSEFAAGFDMVEFELPRTLFGQTGSNKTDFVRIISESREMYEGLIIWAYEQLLARRPSTVETIELLPDFFQNRDFRRVQRIIMSRNEYANF
jgi:hypothetical protein